MLNVLLTIDTEVYPLSPGWRGDRLRPDIDRDIYGVTAEGEFGLRYQLDMLGKHNLKAVFFVEPLFASAPEIGMEPLREVVKLVVDRGHDVQLHAHPEWLDHIPELGMRSGTGLIKDFAAGDQSKILAAAAANLRRAIADVGASERVRVCAFRAGDFAADGATLHALEEIGLNYDSSYNVGYGRLGRGELMMQPQFLGGICEVPVSFFEDWPGHYRPAQLAAASYAELVHALERAERAGWSTFVIVSHSFELLKNRRHATRPVRVRRSVRSRFEKLCAFLDANRNRFEATTFSQFGDPQAILGNAGERLKGRMLCTAMRLGEQLAERLRA